MNQLEAFEENRALVLEKLKEGFLDHLEVVSRIVETQFFQMFLGSGDLERLGESYPSPREKMEVPLSLYLSSQLTLRLHGAPGYSSLPYILHCGGLRDTLEAGQVQHGQDEKTQRRRIFYKGYNDKNTYERRTPCDQDFVRKLARDTEPDRLEAWYACEIARYFRDRGAYDPEGIFIIDGSYLFVPDNKHYEHSRACFFDEHNHPISKEEREKLTPHEQRRCQWRRYYQMVALSHTNRKQDFLLYAGVEVLKDGGEVGKLVPLVKGFVEAVGPGIMKTLLVDRGFIDGASIRAIKECYGVDVVVPLKAKMQITEDAWRLSDLDGKPWQVWEPPPQEPSPDPPQRPEGLRRAEKQRQKTIREKKEARGIKPKPRLERVELKLISRMDLWDECGLPLAVALMREHMSDGEISQWGLMTTRQSEDPLEVRDLYQLRPACEEGWRQTKCYWDLTGFRSAKFSLVVSQVVFVLLAYSLMQVFLLVSDRGELAKATRQKLLASLLPDGEKVAVYWENYVGYFGVREYSEILLDLQEGARRRLLGTLRRLRRLELEPPALPERPI